MSDLYLSNPGESKHTTVTSSGVIISAGSMSLLLVTHVAGGDVYFRFGDSTMVVGDLLGGVANPTGCDRKLANNRVDVELERRDWTHIGLITDSGVTAVVDTTPAERLR